MDRSGNYTDRYGKPIEVGAAVQVAADYSYSGPKEGVGKVALLPSAGSSWYGFPSVRIDGRAYYIPDNALLRVDAEPGSQVAHLEQMLETTRAANAAMRAFLDNA